MLAPSDVIPTVEHPVPMRNGRSTGMLALPEMALNGHCPAVAGDELCPGAQAVRRSAI